MKFPVVGISETWLDDCYHFSDIAGYNFLHKPRVTRVGEGVGLYIGEHLRGCLCKNHPLNFASKIILPETLVTERL